jgi:replicative DNA helicase
VSALTTTPASPTLLDPEASFVGALLHLPAPVAVDALSLVQTEDFADLKLSAIADACRALAVRDVAPDPTTVLAYVRGAALVTGAEAISSLAQLLVELYGTVPTPASVAWYRLGLLDAALRRRCLVLADRVAQAAQGETFGTLMALIVREVQAVLAVQQRRIDAGAVER